MAIAPVQAYVGTFTGAAVTTLGITFGSAVTPGSLIVVWVALQDNAQTQTITSVADNKGNGNYSVAVPLTASPDFGGGGRFPAAIYYLKNVGTGGSSFTITITISAVSANGYLAIGAQEFSGADTVSPLDQINTAQSATATTGYNSAAPVTTSAAGDVSIGNVVLNVGPSAGSGWTVLDVSNLIAGYKVQGAAGSYSAEWGGAASIYLSLHATFKPAGAAPANRLIPSLIGKLR